MVDAPGEVVGGDDEGRGEPDDGLVGLLAEDAASFEGFADRARRHVFSSMPSQSPLPRTSFILRAADVLQAGEGVGAELRGAGAEVFVDQDLEGGAGDGAGERIAAVGAAVVAGAEDAA